MLKRKTSYRLTAYANEKDVTLDLEQREFNRIQIHRRYTCMDVCRGYIILLNMSDLDVQTADDQAIREMILSSQLTCAEVVNFCRIGPSANFCVVFKQLDVLKGGNPGDEHQLYEKYGIKFVRTEKEIGRH